MINRRLGGSTLPPASSVCRRWKRGWPARGRTCGSGPPRRASSAGHRRVAGPNPLDGPRRTT
eukprot:scaffold538678_cov31-Prasinocladus_malaysianus.AAC.1